MCLILPYIDVPNVADMCITFHFNRFSSFVVTARQSYIIYNISRVFDFGRGACGTLKTCSAVCLLYQGRDGNNKKELNNYFCYLFH